MTTQLGSHRLFGGTMMSPVPDPYPSTAACGTSVPSWCSTPSSAAPLWSRALRRHRGRPQDRPRSLDRQRARHRSRDGPDDLEMEGKSTSVSAGSSRRRSRRAREGSTRSSRVSSISSWTVRERRQGRPRVAVHLHLSLRVMAHVMALPIDDFDQFHHWAIDLSISDDPAARLTRHRRSSSTCARSRGSPAQSGKRSHQPSPIHAEIDGEKLGEEEVVSFLRLLPPRERRRPTVSPAACSTRC